MAKVFSTHELITFAIQNEEEGISFYQKMADINAKDKDCYTFLKNEEIEHKKIFSDLLVKQPKKVSSGTYSEEYNQYMQDLVASSIFQNNEFCSTDPIELAICKEKDSILFYSEMLNLVDEEGKDLVTKIIQEEKKHISKLQEIKSKSNKYDCCCCH